MYRDVCEGRSFAYRDIRAVSTYPIRRERVHDVHAAVALRHCAQRQPSHRADPRTSCCATSAGGTRPADNVARHPGSGPAGVAGLNRAIGSTPSAVVEIPRFSSSTVSARTITATSLATCENAPARECPVRLPGANPVARCRPKMADEEKSVLMAPNGMPCRQVSEEYPCDRYSAAAYRRALLPAPACSRECRR